MWWLGLCILWAQTPVHYLVKIKPQAEPTRVLSQLRAKAGAGAHLKAAFWENRWFIWQAFDESWDQTLSGLPEVEYVEKDQPILLSLPEDSSAPETQLLSLSQLSSTVSYQYHQIDSDYLAQVSSTPRAVILVAVIDSGIDRLHPIFQHPISGSLIWENRLESQGRPGVDDDQNGFVDDRWGWNFIQDSPDVRDSPDAPVRGHGTHVAGIIAAMAGGLSRSEAGFQLMALKFVNHQAEGSVSAAVRAIYYAVRMGARIINMSWGSPQYSRALDEALAYAYSQGVLLVAAAGNSAKNNDTEPMFPANYPIPSLLSVAAINHQDQLAVFSNFGRKRVSLAAPGVSILSASPGNGYRFLSGTSMAAPFVTGLAAFIWSRLPHLNHYQLAQVISNGSQSLPQLLESVREGSRLQAQMVWDKASGGWMLAGGNPPPYRVGSYWESQQTENGQMGGCGVIQVHGFNRWWHSWDRRWRPQTGVQKGILVGVLALVPVLVWQLLRYYVSWQQFRGQRRRYERFIMDSDITLWVQGQPLKARLHTISVGGASFQAETWMEKGSIVALSIRSPDGRQEIQVQGRIVWNADSQNYGVQFLQDQIWVKQWQPYLKKAS